VFACRPFTCVGTNHDHDQPSHLVLQNPGLPAVVNLPHYYGPETRCGG
jgi:electron-transferring-flavoprotein dehydrogenase